MYFIQILQLKISGDLERYSDFKQTLQMLEKATSIHFIINENNVTVEEIYQIKN